MKATPAAIPDVLIVEPRVFGDARGFFYESFNARKFKELTSLEPNFVQDPLPRCAKRFSEAYTYILKASKPVQNWCGSVAVS